MIERLLLMEWLKYLGIGAGGGGLLLAGSLIWLHVRIKDNKSGIAGINTTVTEQQKELQSHEVLLAEGNKTMKHLDKRMDENAEKLDMLIKFHLDNPKSK